jgi:hypothetical protein
MIYVEPIRARQPKHKSTSWVFLNKVNPKGVSAFHNSDYDQKRSLFNDLRPKHDNSKRHLKIRILTLF